LENESLIENLTEKEVKEAIFQIEHNKASGHDGFPIEFYQNLWEIIRDDLMALFDNFHKGNFGKTILLAKCSEHARYNNIDLH
jgi:hypothetical protein